MLHCKENAVATPERSNLLQLIAVCWALATLYWTQLNSREHPPEKEQENRLPTGTRASQIAAAPGQQPTPVAVTPTQKKSETKWVHLVRNKEETGPTDQEEEAGPENHLIPIISGDGISRTQKSTIGLLGQLLWRQKKLDSWIPFLVSEGSVLWLSAVLSGLE